MSNDSFEVENDISVISKEDVDEPSMFKVLLHNDDYTTMEFVVEILISVFNKSSEESVKIMFDVHKNGIGVCGIFIKEIAETKVDMVHTLARENGFPLRASLEENEQ